MATKIQRRVDYLLRALPKIKVGRNAQRVEAILDLHRRAAFDPVARGKLERVTALLGSLDFIGETRGHG